MEESLDGSVCEDDKAMIFANNETQLEEVCDCWYLEDHRYRWILKCHACFTVTAEIERILSVQNVEMVAP
ncbi:hypothetical protein MTR_8g098500 [Medicago truncatula]|uniref:Uncharacterized protein n=1 Tax=Medicago truncatula TaxID=3880 RepID=G7LI14_MEDTR|nr:hypothetical protein MTR_8g098500 [Medicago truncatula]